MSAQPAVEFTVVVKTGDSIIDPDPTGAGNTGPIVDLGRGPSINDLGKVAFIARDQPGEYGRVILDAAGVIERNFPITAQQRIGENVEVNNSDQICWDDWVTTNGDTFVRRLDSNTGGISIGIGSFFFNHPFQYVTGGVSINDNGRVIFTGDLKTGGRVLANRADGVSQHNITNPVSGLPTFYPDIANNGTALVRAGGTPSSPLYLFSDASLSQVYVIAEPPAFSFIDEKPGLSDDGVFIAFRGTHQTTGVGIYGEIGGGIPPFKIAGPSGPLIDVSTSFRIGVNARPALGRRIYRVAYVGQSAGPGNELGLYFSDVDITDPTNIVTHPPQLVVERGDSIRGVPGTITDFDVYDALNAGGELVFWIETSTNSQAIVRATTVQPPYVLLDGSAFGTTEGTSGSIRVLADRRIPRSGPYRQGVVADGVTRLIIRVNVDLPGVVELAFDSPGAPGNGLIAALDPASGSPASFQTLGSVTSRAMQIDPPTGPYDAQFVYRAPVNFVRMPGDETIPSRTVGLQYRFLPAGSSWTDWEPIDILVERPPVVLLHGLSLPGRKDETWQGRFKTMNEDPRFRVRIHEYKTSFWSFEKNVPEVRQALEKALTLSRNAGFAATQASFVGYSLGAILPRAYYRHAIENKGKPWERGDNFGGGDINRLIMLNSPQWGSPLALAALAIAGTGRVGLRLVLHLDLPPIGGAIRDLEEGSEALVAIGPTLIPAYALVGVGSETAVSATGQTLRAVADLLPKGNPWQPWLKGISFFTDASSFLLYRNKRHDMVVLEPSQTAGLDSSHTTSFSDSRIPFLEYWHGAVTKDNHRPGYETYYDEVVRLLNAPLSAFSPHIPTPNRRPEAASAPPLQIGVNPVTTDIAIVSPAPGSVLTPGQSFTVEIALLNGFQPIEADVFIENDNETVPLPALTTQTPFQVPIDAYGSFTVLGLAKDAQGNVATGIETYTLHVPASVLSLQASVSTSELRTPLEQAQITTEGIFSDGVLRDLTGSAGGITYSTTPPGIVAVNDDGLVTVLSPGQTTITASRGTLSADVDLLVTFEPSTNYGSGTAGTGDVVPRISTSGGLPQVGNAAFGVEVTDALGGALCAIAGSFDFGETPILGGTLYGDFVTPGSYAMWGITATGSPGVPGDGIATLPIPIPNDPALLGFTTYWQGFVFDSGSPLSIGLSHTNGLAVTVVE